MCDMRQRLLSRLQHVAAQAAAHSHGHKASASIATTQGRGGGGLGAALGEVWPERAGRQQQQQLALLSEQSFRPDAAIAAKAALTTTAAASEGAVYNTARHGGSVGNGAAKPLKAASTATSPTHVQVCAIVNECRGEREELGTALLQRLKEFPLLIATLAQSVVYEDFFVIFRCS